MELAKFKAQPVHFKDLKDLEKFMVFVGLEFRQNLLEAGVVPDVVTATALGKAFAKAIVEWQTQEGVI